MPHNSKIVNDVSRNRCGKETAGNVFQAECRQMRPPILTSGYWFLAAAAGRLVLPGIMALLFRGIGQLIGQDLGGQSCLMSDIVFKVFVLVLPVMRYAGGHAEMKDAFRLNRLTASGGMLSALTGCIGAFLGARLSMMVSWLVQRLGEQGSTGFSAPGTPYELLVMLFIYAFMPAVCEELFFRSGQMSAWERYGTGKALLIVSGLFTLLHASPSGMIVQFVMGIVLGLCAVWNSSVVGAMIAHFAYNALTLALAYGQTAGAVTVGADDMLWLLVWAAVLAGLLSVMKRQANARGIGFFGRSERLRLTKTEVAVMAPGVLALLAKAVFSI